MNLLRKEKGITLIALVITIIVLLILAGVAISMLAGENGILNKANSAKTETDISSEEESVKLAVMSALATGNGDIVSEDAFKMLRDELKKAGCKNFDEITSLPAIAEMPINEYIIEANGTARKPSEIEKLKGGEAVDTTKTLKDAEGKQVVIPEGFKIADDSATLVKDGIVVIAPDDSEFVWVPVEDINGMVMCQGSTGANDCKIEKSGDELICTTHNGKDICGKLYATSIENNFNSELNTQKYSATSGLRESAVLTDTNYGDYITSNADKGVGLIKSIVGITGTDDEIKIKWKTQLQDEYEEMAKSVYENKGFYVGRYETSIKTLEDGTTKVAQSIADVYSTSSGSSSSKSWYGLYQKEKEFSIKNSLTDIVGSTMIWGSQYDQMMLWMEENEYKVKSTDSNDLKGATKNKSYATTGGEGDKDILNNIYDLLGGKTEWTLEANGTNFRAFRGGNSLSANMYSPSYRGSSNPYIVDNYTSSRVSLYIR